MLNIMQIIIPQDLLGKNKLQNNRELCVLKAEQNFFFTFKMHNKIKQLILLLENQFKTIVLKSILIKILHILFR